MAQWRRGDDVPARLHRYVATDWDGDAVAWKYACLRWLDEHPGRRLPFGMFGDRIDVLRAFREIRLSLP